MRGVAPIRIVLTAKAGSRCGQVVKGGYQCRSNGQEPFYSAVKWSSCDSRLDDLCEMSHLRISTRNDVRSSN